MSDDTTGRVLSMADYKDNHAPTLSNDEAPPEYAIFEALFGFDDSVPFEPYEPTPADEANDDKFAQVRTACIARAFAEPGEIDEELHHDAGDSYCLVSLDLFHAILRGME